MSLHHNDWLKIVAALAATATGAGLAGAGPLAGILGGTAATGGAAATTGALGAMSPSIGSALAMQGLTGGLATAMPKYGESQPGATPPSGAAGMDFQQLVGGGQNSQQMLPHLRLQDRLPKPPDPFAFQAPTGY